MLKNKKINVILLVDKWDDRRKDIKLRGYVTILRVESGSITGKSGIFYIKDGDKRVLLLEDKDKQECIYYTDASFSRFHYLKYNTPLQLHEVNAILLLRKNKLFSSFCYETLFKNYLNLIGNSKRDRLWSVQFGKKHRKVNKFFKEVCNGTI